MLAPARSKRRRSRIRREDSPPPSMSQLNSVDIPQLFAIPSSIRPQFESHSQRNLVSSTNTSQSNSVLSLSTGTSSSSASLSPLARRTSIQFPNLQMDNNLLSSTIPTSPSFNHFDISYSNQSYHQQQYDHLPYHHHHHHQQQQQQQQQSRRGHPIKSTRVSLIPTRRLSINNHMNDDNKDNDNNNNNNNDILDFSNMLNVATIDNLSFREEQLESQFGNSYSSMSPQLSSQSSFFAQSIQNHNSRYSLNNNNNNNNNDIDFTLPFHLQSPPISPTHTSSQNKLNCLNRKYHFNQFKYNKSNSNSHHYNNNNITNNNRIQKLIHDAKNKLQSIEQSLNEDAWIYYGTNPLENI